MTAADMIPVATTREVWRTCRSLLRRRVWLALGVAVAFVVAAAAGLVLPTALGRIVDLATDRPGARDRDRGDRRSRAGREPAGRPA
jgi:hypothetical protein